MQSFRSVLRSLRLVQVETYLEATGWLLCEQSRNENVFSFTDQNSDVAYVKLPNSNGNNSIDHLYRAVFYVSCVEDRQPMEVALDIHRQKVEVPAEISLRDILIEAIQAHTDISAAETEELLKELEPSIARAEFMTAGIEPTAKTAQIMTAMVLVPATQYLQIKSEEAAIEQVVSVFVHAAMGLSNSRTSNHLIRKLYKTAAGDDANAPSETLMLLAELSPKKGIYERAD